MITRQPSTPALANLRQFHSSRVKPKLHKTANFTHSRFRFTLLPASPALVLVHSRCTHAIDTTVSICVKCSGLLLY